MTPAELKTAATEAIAHRPTEPVFFGPSSCTNCGSVVAVVSLNLGDGRARAGWTCPACPFSTYETAGIETGGKP